MSDGKLKLFAGRYKLEVVKAPHLPAYMTVDTDCVVIASAIVFAPSSPMPGVIIVTATPVEAENVESPDGDVELERARRSRAKGQ